MATYAVVGAGGEVVNLVEWNGTDEWSPGPGLAAVPATPAAQIGGRWDGTAFQPPAAEP